MFTVIYGKFKSYKFLEIRFIYFYEEIINLIFRYEKSFGKIYHTVSFNNKLWNQWEY